MLSLSRNLFSNLKLCFNSLIFHAYSFLCILYSYFVSWWTCIVSWKANLHFLILLYYYLNTWYVNYIFMWIWGSGSIKSGALAYEFVAMSIPYSMICIIIIYLHAYCKRSEGFEWYFPGKKSWQKPCGTNRTHPPNPELPHFYLPSFENNNNHISIDRKGINEIKIMMITSLLDWLLVLQKNWISHILKSTLRAACNLAPSDNFMLYY